MADRPGDRLQRAVSTEQVSLRQGWLSLAERRLSINSKGAGWGRSASGCRVRFIALRRCA